MGKNKADLLAEEFSKASTKKTQKTKGKGGKPTMKKTVLTILATVVITLGIVGAFVATFYAGVNHEAKKQSDIKARVEAAVVSREELKK